MAGKTFKDDFELVKGLKSGDEACFDALFCRYSSAIFKICRYYYLSTEVSEELVQDVFLKIWENRNKINITLSFKSYLYTIAKNQILKEIRRNTQHTSFLRYSVYVFKGSEKSTENQVYFNDLVYQTKNLVNQLSPQRREVFILNRFEGFSTDDIAEKMNISKRTVEHHLYHAQKFIRQQLKVLRISVIALLLLLF